MRFTFTILAALAALVVVQAIEVEPVSDDWVTQLTELADIFKTTMKLGRTDLGIPVMDPAVIPQIAIGAKFWPIRGQFLANNIKLSGASDFELTNVAQISGTNKVSVQITIPTINLQNSYDFEGTVNVGLIKFNVQNQGPIEATIEGLKVSAVVELVVDTDNELTLRSLDVESWSYDNIVINFNDFASAGFVKQNFNKLLNKLAISLLVTPHYEDLSLWASQNGELLLTRFLDILEGRVVVPNLDNRASDLLEQLKSVLKQGSTTLPVLDPTTIDSVAVLVENSRLDASIVGSEIKIDGTSRYTITNITRKEGTNQLAVELEVDEIVANGIFNATGKIVLWVAKVPLQDSGSLKLTIKGLKVVATANVYEDISGFLYLKELEINSWDYSEIKTEFGNLQNAQVGIIINNVINKMLPLIVQAKKAGLTSWAQETSKLVLERFLSGVASESASPINVQLTSISKEAQDIISQLIHLNQRVGLAEAA